MKSILTKTLNMKTEVLCLSFTLLSTACAPMSFTPSNLAGEAAAVSPMGGAVSPVVIDNSGDIVDVVGATQGSVPVTPAANPIVDTSVPFVATIDLPKCKDMTQDQFAFDLTSGADAKIATAQMSHLPATSNGKMEYESYTVYAVAEQDGKLVGEKVNLDATIDDKRVYGHFNCLIQTSVVNDLAEKMSVPWMNVAPKMQLRIKMPEYENIKFVGIAVVNQSTDQMTLRCFK